MIILLVYELKYVNGIANGYTINGGKQVAKLAWRLVDLHLRSRRLQGVGAGLQEFYLEVDGFLAGQRGVPGLDENPAVIRTDVYPIEGIDQLHFVGGCP